MSELSDDRLERALAELGRLAGDLGPALAPVGTAELLRAVTMAARELFGAAACSLALLTEDEAELVFTTAAGSGADDVTGLRIPSGKGIAGWVVMSGQPIVVSDLQRDPRFARDVAEQTGYVPASILAVPVASPNRLLGVMEILDRDEHRPGAERDMSLLALFADQAALAIDGARAFADLGRVLLRSMAAAVSAPSAADLADASVGADVTDAPSAADTPHASLPDALAAAAAALPSPDRDLAELAALFADLGRQGPEERRLAVRVLREFAAYARRRERRLG